MGCNTSQEQPPSTLNVNNEDGSVKDGADGKLIADEPSVPSSTMDKPSSAEIHNETSSKENHSSTIRAPKASADETDSQTISNGIDAGDEEDEEKAALKIQAVFRGHKVRAEMKKSDAPEKSNNKEEKPSSEVPSAMKPEEEENENFEEIFDPNDKELFDAASKIQATFRGHLQRKVGSGGKDQVDIDEITKKVAEELDIDLSDPELNKAATKIQASFRGHKVRRTTPN